MSYALTIGFITYGKSTAKYLPYFLSSLKNQIFNNYSIIAFDNTENSDSENTDYIKSNYPEIEILRAGENIGFARAYNKMISKAVEYGTEYFLAVNPDMILEPNAVEKMIKAMDGNKELGSVCPKILRWDFEQTPQSLAGDYGEACGKTKIIDTCGIQEISALRFKDIGQGEIDSGQYDNAEILGPSGACAMYRISALKKIVEMHFVETNSVETHCNASLRNSFLRKNNQYFDELMFMYKEDCDLAYRLFLAGFKSKCVADAIVYHDRTVKANGNNNLQVALNRKSKSRQAKKWSFLNQHIMFIKYWRILSAKQKLEVLWFAFRMFAFTVVFEQYLFGQYLKLWKIRKNISNYCHPSPRVGIQG